MAKSVNVVGKSEDTFLLEITAKYRKIKYQLRSLFQTAVFQGFNMNKLSVGSEFSQSLLVSLPFYSHLS